MSRELLPNRFSLRLRKTKAQNIALLNMLIHLGIKIHGESTNPNHVNWWFRNALENKWHFNIRGHHVSGSSTATDDIIYFEDVLEAYGKSLETES